MTTKKVSFGTTPKAMQPPAPPPSQEVIDRWVEHRTLDEPLKRLSLDLPASLHTRIKVDCARRGVKMVDEIRAMLEARFPQEGKA